MLDKETSEQIEQTREKYPFLTFLISEGNVRMGIVQNASPRIITFYDIEQIEAEADRNYIIELGDRWWWESNQNVPVNIFIGSEFDKFKDVLVGVSRKSLKDMVGPCFSLHEKYIKRMKKKKIQILNIHTPPRVAVTA